MLDTIVLLVCLAICILVPTGCFWRGGIAGEMWDSLMKKEPIGLLFILLAGCCVGLLILGAHCIALLGK